MKKFKRAKKNSLITCILISILIQFFILITINLITINFLLFRLKGWTSHFKNIFESFLKFCFLKINFSAANYRIHLNLLDCISGLGVMRGANEQNDQGSISDEVMR